MRERCVYVGTCVRGTVCVCECVWVGAYVRGAMRVYGCVCGCDIVCVRRCGLEKVRACEVASERG